MNLNKTILFVESLFQKADDIAELDVPWVDWCPLSIQCMQSVNIYCAIMPPPCTSSYESQVLLFTGDRRMPRWQYIFFFFVWGRLFFISHLMLTCKLLRARVTIADDSFVLSPLRLRLLMLWFSWNPLWPRHKWDRERKHRLENTPKAPALEPVVSLEAVGDFGQNNCYCPGSVFKSRLKFCFITFIWARCDRSTVSTHFKQNITVSSAHMFTSVVSVLFCLVRSLQLLQEKENWKERKKEGVPSLQFGEIYEWTKPKSVRMYTQREFGRRDLRSAVWVIIQSSCSHISHFESHRLWERTDLSYTQVAHVQAPKKPRKAKTTRAHKLIGQMFFFPNVIFKHEKISLKARCLEISTGHCYSVAASSGVEGV